MSTTPNTTKEVEDIHKWQFVKEDKYHETWRSDYVGEIEVYKPLLDHIRTTLTTPKPTPEVEEIVNEFNNKFFIGGKNAYGEEKPLLFPAKVEVRDWLIETITTLTAKHEADMEKAVEAERIKLADWIKDHKGVSSTAIYVYMTTGKLPKPFDCPYDEWDRARCVVLLKAVPKWGNRLTEIEQAEIKGIRNGVEVYPWREQIPLIREALTPTMTDQTTEICTK